MVGGGEAPGGPGRAEACSWGKPGPQHSLPQRESDSSSERGARSQRGTERAALSRSCGKALLDAVVGPVSVPCPHGTVLITQDRAAAPPVKRVQTEGSDHVAGSQPHVVRDGRSEVTVSGILEQLVNWRRLVRVTCTRFLELRHGLGEQW
ncbi:hypothetical protein AAES_30448 [Amazona aestiva]|uniref:Uncharacterized protein n=1 Tax=Amazona aestiva TaxID=12930 RepID=A0A0Q3VS22_AMAAE|nr:hypothetical protein AAES_30448 [Amazona aestiva]